MNIKYIDRLNILTQYPEIQDYYCVPNNDESTTSDKKDLKNEFSVYITEKIEGTHARIVVFTNEDGYLADFFIGDKDSLIFAKGDRTAVDQHQIIPYCIDVIDAIRNKEFQSQKAAFEPDSMYVFYGQIPTVNNRTGSKRLDFRIFDILTAQIDDVLVMLNQSVDSPQFIKWKSDNNKNFLRFPSMRIFLFTLGLAPVKFINQIFGKDLSKMLKDLKHEFSKNGEPKAVILRNETRTIIKKVCFEE